MTPAKAGALSVNEPLILCAPVCCQLLCAHFLDAKVHTEAALPQPETAARMPGSCPAGQPSYTRGCTIISRG